MPDRSQRIAQIRAVLQSGITSSNIDGTAVTIDPDQLRAELQQLMSEDDTERRRKPRLSSVNISRLF